MQSSEVQCIEELIMYILNVFPVLNGVLNLCVFSNFKCMFSVNCLTLGVGVVFFRSFAVLHPLLHLFQSECFLEVP